MRRSLLGASALRSKLPAYLSLALLACQLALIWIAPAFPTQDGPSHLYNAVLLRELLLHRASPYRSMYVLNHAPVPNWTLPILLNVALITGPVHAEQVLATIAILLLYGAIYYAQKALSPRNSLLWPGMNALLNVWFLYMGFYSFYLGVGLSILCVGFYLKHLRNCRAKQLLWIGLLLVLLYFTHPMAQALTFLILSIICLWNALLGHARLQQEIPGQRGPAQALKHALRSCAPLLLAMTPGILFLLNFLRQEKFEQSRFAAPVSEAISRLFFVPAPIFILYYDDIPLLSSYVICTLLIFAVFSSLLFWKRKNWLSTHGAIIVATVLMFLMYWTAPHEAAGGLFLEERLAWMILLFAVLAASASVRSRMLFSAMSLFLFPFVAVQLLHGAILSPSVNRAVAVYDQLDQYIRPNSTLVRLNYPAEQFEEKLHLRSLHYDPLVHAVDRVALRKRCLNWSNYEATSDTFPVIFRSLNPGDGLVQGFEDKYEKKAEDLESFLDDYGEQVDYIIVYGQLPQPGKSSLARNEQKSEQEQENDLPAVLDLLKQNYDLISTSGEGPVLRLFRRKGLP